jgi:hypothetical protein
MTDRERANEFFNKIVEMKKAAIKSGANQITYTDIFGNTRNEYYHSLRWNDRPASVRRYK